MLLKKLSFGMIVGLVSVQAAAFSDIGTSKRGCKSAERDAQVIAQSHCYSLDTTPKIKMGTCKKKKINGQTEFRIPVYYKCQVQTVSFDYQ